MSTARPVGRLTSSRRVLHHFSTTVEEAVPDEERVVTFAQGDDYEPRERLSMSFVDWVDFGSPGAITVTILPGDLLNDAGGSS